MAADDLSHTVPKSTAAMVFIMSDTLVFVTSTATSHERHGISITNTRVFLQQFVGIIAKKHQGSVLLAPLWGESTGERWIPLAKDQWRGKRHGVMIVHVEEFLLPTCCNMI